MILRPGARTRRSGTSSFFLGLVLVACSSGKDGPKGVDVAKLDCAMLGAPKIYGESGGGSRCTGTSECCGFCNSASFCMCFPAGVPCTTGRDCCSGTCDRDKQECVIGDTGSMCQRNSDCKDGFCGNGRCGGGGTGTGGAVGGKTATCTVGTPAKSCKDPTYLTCGNGFCCPPNLPYACGDFCYETPLDVAERCTSKSCFTCGSAPTTGGTDGSSCAGMWTFPEGAACTKGCECGYQKCEGGKCCVDVSSYCSATVPCCKGWTCEFDGGPDGRCVKPR
jgi:hypothetical protein